MSRADIKQPPHSAGRRFVGHKATIDDAQIPSVPAMSSTDQAIWSSEPFLTCDSRRTIPLATSDFNAVDQGQFGSRWSGDCLTGVDDLKGIHHRDFCDRLHTRFHTHTTLRPLARCHWPSFCTLLQSNVLKRCQFLSSILNLTDHLDAPNAGRTSIPGACGLWQGSAGHVIYVASSHKVIRLPRQPTTF